jgi:hypothetical protein
MATLYGFIPHRLSIDVEPELNNFPYNVMFMSYAGKNGKVISGTALYFPDLSTFREVEEISKMIYRNKYGINSWLEIKHNTKNDTYEGTKFIKGEWSGEATGKDWKQFFVHFTMLGLVKDEECEFKDEPNLKLEG